MANYTNLSRILAAAIVSASATLLPAAPGHATVNSEVQETRQVITVSGAVQISGEESVRMFLGDGHSFGTTVDARNDAYVRVSAQSRRLAGVRNAKRKLAPRRRATTGQNAAGSLSNGGGQQPQLGGAGDEFKKFLEKMPKPHCGGKHSIC